MIRTRSRLGDATQNITNTVGPAEGLSAPVQNWIQASLTAQGIDPSTASSSQIMSAYQQFAGQQTFANLAPVYNPAVQIATAALQATGPAPGPQLPTPVLPTLQPMPLVPLPAATGSTSSFSLSSVPWYGWAALGIGFMFIGGRK